MLPDSLLSSSIAASATMKSAIQADTLTFRLCVAAPPRRQYCHHAAPLPLAHIRPAGDLIKRAAAAPAKTGSQVDLADLNARGFQAELSEGHGGLCRGWHELEQSLLAARSTQFLLWSTIFTGRNANPG